MLGIPTRTGRLAQSDHQISTLLRPQVAFSSPGTTVENNPDLDGLQNDRSILRFGPFRAVAGRVRRPGTSLHIAHHGEAAEIGQMPTRRAGDVARPARVP
jgi:hypothetical protein